MIDFHSHFLPGIDDGSDSVETSLSMLAMWRDQGFSLVCATPHFYADRNSPARFLAKRQAAYDAVCTALEKLGGVWPEILLGAEVRFFDGISAAEDLDKLCLEGTNLLLLEMPFTRWTDRMVGEVSDISRRGLLPVAAHIERYMDLQPRKLLDSFMEGNILIQCNAEFFLSRRTSRKALRMLRDGRIHFLGSDAHNTSSRAPNLGPALELIRKKLDGRVMDRLDRNESLITDE